MGRMDTEDDGTETAGSRAARSGAGALCGATAPHPAVQLQSWEEALSPIWMRPPSSSAVPEACCY